MSTVINFKSVLQSIKTRGLFRSLKEVQGPQGSVVRISGRDLVNFCSNDYLGLAGDRRLISAMQRAVERYGVGSGASPLVCGRSEAHALLEQRLAQVSGRDRALVFASGYQANLAVVTALGPGRDGTVVEDRLSHASLIDGAVLSRARLVRFQHRDCASLEQRLQENGTKKLVLTDSVFSMDGDIAPLPAIAALCNKYQALLAVDDAHGFGVLGDHGMGALALFGLHQAEVPILILTFGKAAGVSGACVAGPADIIEMLIQKARPYIYSTAIPPALAATVTASIEIIKSADDRRSHLSNLINIFRRGVAQLSLPVAESITPIQPLIVGSNAEALRVSEELYARGFLVAAIRPPTVPANSSRLRITLTAAHSETQVKLLLDALQAARIKGGR